MKCNPMKLVAISIILIFTSSTNIFGKSKKSLYYDRVFNLNTVIDIKMTELVNEKIDLVINQKTTDSRFILGRTALYFPKIENILREKGLPDELKYIAVIESSLIPYAVSRQGATGLWQFMKGTALLYGMEISKYIDERKDVEVSTEKAANYLSALYKIYGNWTVVLAAYNCGPGNVNKAIKKAGGVIDYWKIAPYLPKETREYVPRFIAASYLMNYYYLHGLEPIEPSKDLMFTGAVRVFDKVHFKDLEKDLGINMTVLKLLNPLYVKNIIPGSETGKYILTLPEPALALYLQKTQNFENLVYLGSSTNNGVVQNSHAEAFVLDTEALKEEGMLFLQHRLTQVFSNNTSFNNLSQEIQVPLSRKNTHTLKRKESLAALAEQNNMSLADLMILNGLVENDDVSINTEINLTKYP